MNGTASFDNCEICSGGTTGIEPCIADCNGDFGGTATTDLCGVCDANPDYANATFSDCNGDVNGAAFLASFNTMSADTLYEGIRDLNCDSVIDISDLTLLLMHYGMVGDIPGSGQ